MVSPDFTRFYKTKEWRSAGICVLTCEEFWVASLDDSDQGDEQKQPTAPAEKNRPDSQVPAKVP
jgi:hypothetical protein